MTFNVKFGEIIIINCNLEGGVLMRVSVATYKEKEFTLFAM